MIRQATRNDFEFVAKMSEKFCKVAGLPFRLEDFKKFFLGVVHSNDNDFLLSDHGMIVAVSSPWVTHSECILAQEMAWWVEPEFRGTGEGKELILAFIDWAKQRKASFVSMSAIEHIRGEAVTKLYNELGFERRETSYVKVL